MISIIYKIIIDISLTFLAFFFNGGTIIGACSHFAYMFLTLEDLHDALIDIIGAFSYTYWMEGKTIFENDKVQYIQVSKKSYKDAFITNKRLFMNHYKEKNMYPSLSNLDTMAYDYNHIDNIIFKPTRRFDVITNEEDISEQRTLDIPGLPLDLWVPLFKNEREIIAKFTKDKLKYFEAYVSDQIARELGYYSHSGITLKQLKTTSKTAKFDAENVRNLLEEIYAQYEKKIRMQYEEILDGNKDAEKRKEILHYLSLVRLDLFNLLFLYKYQGDWGRERSTIENYLDQESGFEEIVLEFPSLSSLPPDKDLFKSLVLNNNFYMELDSKRFLDTYKNAIRVDVQVYEKKYKLSEEQILDDLKEPISEFGKILRNLAESKQEEIFIIALDSSIEGYGVKSYRGNYVKYADKKVELGAQEYPYWILDGSSEKSIEKFYSDKGKDRYGEVLRALIQGKYTFMVFTKKNKNEIENVVIFNLVQGVIKIDELLLPKVISAAHFILNEGLYTAIMNAHTNNDLEQDFRRLYLLFQKNPLFFTKIKTGAIPEIYFQFKF